MTKRGLFNWSIWIGLLSGIYTLLYAMSPLSQYNVMYASFVALPIYFLAGAQKKEFFHFSGSFAIGAVWGWIYLVFIGWLGTNLKMSGPVSNAVGVLIVTIILCALHFILTPNTIFNKVPAMFAATGIMFSTGGANLIPVIVTLILGTALAYLCNLGTRFLNEEGMWSYSKSK